MAKGQVSEEELAKGLKGIGNFGGLTEPRVRRDNPFRDSRSEAPRPAPVKTIDVKPVVGEKPAPEPGNAVAKIARKTVGPAAKLSKEPARLVEKEEPSPGGRKADIFTVPVTLKISPEMRDAVERLARELQRARTSKKERITSNTVIRAAIVLVMKHFTLKHGNAPNTEEELYELLEQEFRLSAR